MKKRRTKKWPFLMLFILIVLIFGALYFFKGYFMKNNNKPEEKPETVVKEKEYSTSVTFAGGILINNYMWSYTKTSEGYDFEPIFENVNDMMKKSDVNFYFQESILGGVELGASGNRSGKYLYNSPSDLITTLTKVGFNMASLASYHAYDEGITGIKNSVKLLNDNKLVYSGINQSENKNNSNIVTKNNIKIGLLSYTLGTDEVVVESYAVNVYDSEKVKEDVENLKKDVDVVIVSIEWNNLNSNEITAKQEEVVKELSDLGVNIIVGNTNYSIQPIKMVGDTLVCYSLGNLLTGHTSIDSRISMMVDLDIKKKGEKITIDDINVGLYYAYNVNNSKFKVLPFAKIEKELNNYKTYYDKYKELLTKDNENIEFYNIGD